MANDWAVGREAELKKPGVLDKIHTAGTTLGAATDLYVEAFDDGT